MGRYISGDINRKLWFGIQDTDAASRFGGTECEPSYIEYYFGEEDLENINKELETIKTNLGDIFDKFEEIDIENTGYSNKTLNDINATEEHLSEYADYLLGVEIRDCILKTGECNFQAEY